MFEFIGSIYSSIFNKVSAPLQQKQKEAFVKSKLLEIKQKKRERDIQLSSKIATTRDRVVYPNNPFLRIFPYFI